MSLFTKRRLYASSDHDGLLYVEYGRWWLGRKLVNVCFWDGVKWSQPSETIMDDSNLLAAWIKASSVIMEHTKECN